MAAIAKSGIVYIKLDGVQYMAKGDFKYKLGGLKREASRGVDGHTAMKEMFENGKIEGNIADPGSLDLKAIQTAENISVQLEMNNGKVVVLRNAFYTGDAEMDAIEGQTTIVFEGPECVEMPTNAA
jgi:hypothetical protein